MVQRLVTTAPTFAAAWREQALLDGCRDTERLTVIDRGLAAEPDAETEGMPLDEPWSWNDWATATRRCGCWGSWRSIHGQRWGRSNWRRRPCGCCWALGLGRRLVGIQQVAATAGRSSG